LRLSVITRKKRTGAIYIIGLNDAMDSYFKRVFRGIEMGRVIKGQMIEKKRENACPFVVIETPRKQNEKRSSTIKYHKKYYYYYYYREGKRVGVARNRRVIKPSNKKAPR
jgi:hypothetical protein